MEFLTKYVFVPLAIIFAIIVLLYVFGSVKNSVLYNPDGSVVNSRVGASLNGKIKRVGPDMEVINNNVISTCNLDTYMCSDGKYVKRSGSECSFKCSNGQIIK